MKATIEVEGVAFDVEIERREAHWEVLVEGQAFRIPFGGKLHVGGRAIDVKVEGAAIRVDGAPRRVRLLFAGTAAGPAGSSASRAVHPPMMGRLEAIAARVGERVKKGDVLFVLEAMKMHNEVRSPADATVKAVRFPVGATVDRRDVVVELEP
ncbi:MAG: biotin/lipoyl-containing protein [Thermoplasmatota archaeon]